mmetsp:Transcript_25335/g.83259  ORF Transcript_25335/g.83259 Transcript_25335/m.83259 type:complete len:97 (-) Transcript_25335:2148-2438(-)
MGRGGGMAPEVTVPDGLGSAATPVVLGEGGLEKLRGLGDGGAPMLEVRGDPRGFGAGMCEGRGCGCGGCVTVAAVAAADGADGYTVIAAAAAAPLP